MQVSPRLTYHRSNSGKADADPGIAATLLVVVSIGFPVYKLIRQNSYKADTLYRMNKIGQAIQTYVAQNGGLLPDEDAKGTIPGVGGATRKRYCLVQCASEDLGWQLGGGVCQFSSGLLQSDNVLYCPGADYPEKRKLEQPYFAIAMNTKLAVKDAQGIRSR